MRTQTFRTNVYATAVVPKSWRNLRCGKACLLTAALVATGSGGHVLPTARLPSSCSVFIDPWLHLLHPVVSVERVAKIYSTIE
jgi:hypothetical protein